VGLITIAVLLILYLLMSNSTSLGIGGIGVLLLIMAMRMIADQFDNYARRQEKAIRRADRGAKAEEEVGDLLYELDDDFIVVNDVESPYGNIDHVLLTQKGGIYLIETKSHHGTVTTFDGEILVNGDLPEKDFAAQALQNSYWLREEIERWFHVNPWVTPLVVFTNAFVKFGPKVKGVRAINHKFLLRTLRSGQSRSTLTAAVWENRDQIVRLLNGQQPSTTQAAPDVSVYRCPRCGKTMIEKVAKGGRQVGKRFLVCPDYPQCKTAVPIEG
jgi:ssDNA-binding Zn-finger/Zn-ribbon topoisomerase 1